MMYLITIILKLLEAVNQILYFSMFIKYVIIAIVPFYRK